MKIAIFEDGRCVAGNTIEEMMTAAINTGILSGTVSKLFELPGVYLPDGMVHTVLERREYEDNENYSSVEVFASENEARKSMSVDANACAGEEDGASMCGGNSQIEVTTGAHTYQWRLEKHPVIMPENDCKWNCTDPDCCQHMRHNGAEYEMIQAVWLDLTKSDKVEGHHPYCIVKGSVNLSDYTANEIETYVSPYNFVDQPDEWLIAECILEQILLSDEYVIEDADSLKEAEQFVEKYIQQDNAASDDAERKWHEQFPASQENETPSTKELQDELDNLDMAFNHIFNLMPEDDEEAGYFTAALEAIRTKQEVLRHSRSFAYWRSCTGCRYESDMPSHEKCHGCARMYGDHYQVSNENDTSIPVKYLAVYRSRAVRDAQVYTGITDNDYAPLDDDNWSDLPEAMVPIGFFYADNETEDALNKLRTEVAQNANTIPDAIQLIPLTTEGLL